MAVFRYYAANKSELRQYRVMLKLAAFKLIVILTFVEKVNCDRLLPTVNNLLTTYSLDYLPNPPQHECHDAYLEIDLLGRYHRHPDASHLSSDGTVVVSVRLCLQSFTVQDQTVRLHAHRLWLAEFCYTASALLW